MSADQARIFSAAQFEGLRLLTNDDTTSHSPFACVLGA
jgi:type II secretory pathway predicted ATPase ExeA